MTETTKLQPLGSTAGLDAADCPYCGGNDETPPDHCMDCITRSDRQEHHYPVEWGPSDDPHFTCSCGHPDPAHHKAANASGKPTAANMLRGMTLDPAIPQHAKGAMWEKIQELEKALEKLLIELEG